MARPRTYLLNEKYFDIIDSEYPKPFYFKGKVGVAFYDWFVTLGEDEHEYLYNTGYNGFALIHYPDCKKCIKKDTL